MYHFSERNKLVSAIYLISDALMVSKFHNGIHDSERLKIYTIVLNNNIINVHNKMKGVLKGNRNV